MLKLFVYAIMSKRITGNFFFCPYILIIDHGLFFGKLPGFYSMNGVDGLLNGVLLCYLFSFWWVLRYVLACLKYMECIYYDFHVKFRFFGRLTLLGFTVLRWVSKLIRKRHESSVTNVAWHPNNVRSINTISSTSVAKILIRLLIYALSLLEVFNKLASVHHSLK